MSKPPIPLTAPPPPDLDWSRDGVPASKDYDDIYFSVDGGLAETAAVFLQGCDLPNAWVDTEVFTIGELGFGSGLNFLAAWDVWQQTAKPSQQLHFLSIEAHPWTVQDLQKALSHFPELKPLWEQLIQIWPGQVKGLHRIHLDNVHLTLFHMGAENALDVMDGQVNAWFLDGFSPSKNPHMWSDAIFKSIASLSTSHARLATFTVAGHVRRGLSEAGFNVEKKTGFGRKRERLEAVYSKPVRAHSQHNQQPPIIIGGGIAGASVAKAFIRRGIKPILIDPETNLASAASGNPCALVMPRLDLQDRPESRFFLSAYLYAARQYQETNAVLKTGICQIAKSDNEAKRFEKLISQSPLPSHHMQDVSRQDTEQLTGIPLCEHKSGLYFPQALLVNPKQIIDNWLQNCIRIQHKVTAINKIGDTWQVLGNNAQTLVQSQTVFICAGANILDLTSLDVRFTRGQICWGNSNTVPNISLISEGYAAPYSAGILLGATHAHVDAGQNNAIRVDETRENISQYEALTGQKIEDTDWQARTAVRVTTKDTLPISGQIKDGLYVMSGLGARGFMMAPLLGEALVCQALSEPSPLCKNTQLRFRQK